MSSVVKKSSHFTPKLIKRPIRRNVAENLNEIGVITPPATQKPDEEEAQKNIGIEEISTDYKTTTIAEDKNDPASFISDDALSKKHVERILENRNIEPIADEDDDLQENTQDFGDNDIFKAPYEGAKSRRSSSIHIQRRLSAMSGALLRNRSGSVSESTVNTSSIPPEGNEVVPEQLPMKIGIPIAKPSKRKASISVATKGASKRPTLVSKSKSIIEDSQITAKTEPAEELAKFANESGFVYGIDPKSNRLRKFRSERIKAQQLKQDDASILDAINSKDIPVAPSNLGTTITSLKQLPRKFEDADLTLISKVAVDYNTITMADLCKPNLPIGQISDNYHLVKEAQDKIRKERLKKRVDRMRARAERKALIEVSGEEIQHPKKDNNLLNWDETKEEQMGIQLSMQDGNIVVNEDSTVINRHHIERGGQSREESNPFENPVTSSTYSKRKHTDRWTPDELKQFYNALSTWGTDFSFIAQLFPYRTRRQIKSKFNLEEKRYPEIVEMALRRKLPADFDKYCESSKSKIETLEYYNEELKQIRLKHAEDMATIMAEREKAIQEDAENSRRREVQIRTGSKSLTRAEKMRELRKNETVVGSIDDIKKK